MATFLKVLGQSAPSAATLITLYTTPASTTTAVSTLVVCNRSATATTFSVAVRPAGAVISDQMYLYYLVRIDGNETFTATLGISLAATDVVSVLSTLASCSFSIFGQENT